MAVPWKCACGATNDAEWLACEGCGTVRATLDPPTRSTSRCLSCGGPEVNGRCAKTGGFSATKACPFSCPICRSALGWEGGCEGCHGCTTGRREDWTFPGDRYELVADSDRPKEGPHWLRTDGKRRACTPAENKAGFAAIRAILGPVLERQP